MECLGDTYQLCIVLSWIVFFKTWAVGALSYYVICFMADHVIFHNGFLKINKISCVTSVLEP